MGVIATETKRLSHLVKNEFWPDNGYCRKAVTAYEASAATYAVGTVLGKVITSGSATATAGAGNTGDGTISAITVAAPAQVGNYSVLFTSTGATASFVVADPNGALIGQGAVGTAFSAGGLGFTFTDGAADFTIGDTYVIAVAGTYKYKAAVETATDGSDVFAAVVLEDKTVAATTDTTVLAMYRGPAAVSKAALNLDASYDSAAKLLIVYDAMEAAGIMVLDAV